MQISPARHAAFEVLQRVEHETAYASNLLASDRYANLERDDRSLLQELVLGVLRWQSQLDFLIERYAGRALSKLDSDVVLALRLGIYQLRFLSRVPAHAAINESVNIVRRRKLASAAPFVNAILRACQREQATSISELTGPIADPMLRLSIEVSHPTWLVERWVARYGEQTARALAEAGNSPPRTAFRFNARTASEDRTREWLATNGIGIRKSKLVPDAAVIDAGHLNPNAAPIRDGWIYLQDEASQLVARIAVDHRLQETPLRNALDICAAPGSKATLLSTLLPENAAVVAGDIHHHRLQTLVAIAGRLDANRVFPVRLDGTRPLPFNASSFELVLLDAPCSGLGTLQRHPEIKWKGGAGQIAELSGLQRELIERASDQVGPGGTLTYAVCSTEPEEGEEVVASFRRQHMEFRDITRERLVELGNDADDLLTSSHGARSFTHRHGTESFFFCVLWKRR